MRIRIIPVMRNVIPYIVCLFIIPLFSNAYSNSTANKPIPVLSTEDTINYYLEINGSIRQMKNVTGDSGDNPWLDSAVVTVYMNNAVYFKDLTSKRGKCSFKLSLNRQYTIELSKQGFVSKRFEINTKIPSDKKDVFDFDFDMDIFEKVEGLDVSVLDKPIAKVIYDAPNNQFVYDVNYTTRINSDLKLMYRNYYLLSKKVKSKANSTKK